MKWELESELALRAVSVAGEMVLEYPDRAVIGNKGNNRDIVTDFEKPIEQYISMVLRASTFDVIGEEFFQQGESKKKVPCWFIDPIDGTVNYVSGMPYYGVSAGLLVEESGHETFVAGAVSLPGLRELYFTYGDQGAYLNGRLLKVGHIALKDALIAASFAGNSGQMPHRNKEFELFGRINDASRGCLRLGSAAANLCFVAAGKLQAAYGLHSRLWDVAGGLAIARQAGCKIYTSRESESMRIDYIAAWPSVADELKEMCSEVELSESCI